MFIRSRAIKLAGIIAATATILSVVATPSRAETCRVRLHIVKAGFIIGVGGGDGRLYCSRGTYRLSLGGIGIGSLGVAAVDLAGTASNIQTPSDIAGAYSAAGAGAAFVAGGQVATLQNAKGVVLQVHGVQAGFQVSLGLGGLTIAMR